MRQLHSNWKDLFHVFRIALDLRKLSLSFIAIAITGISGCIFLLLGEYIRADKVEKEIITSSLVDKQALPYVIKKVRQTHSYHFNGVPFRGITERSWVAMQVRDMMSHIVPPAAARQYMSYLWPRTMWGASFICIFLLWSWLWWGYYGGAISRIAAVEIAYNERIEIAQATRYAFAKRWSYVFAPLLVVLLVISLFLLLTFGGWICTIPFLGKLFLICGFPLALIFGFLIVVLLIGLVFCWGLMGAVISVEGTDMMDAVSRTYSYMFFKPFSFILYLVIGLCIGVFASGFVLWCTSVCIDVALCGLSTGMGESFAPVFSKVHTWVALSHETFEGSAAHAEASFGTSIASFAIVCVLMIVIGFAWSYIPSYFFSLQTMIYLLLRKETDATNMRDVFDERQLHVATDQNIVNSIVSEEESSSV